MNIEEVLLKHSHGSEEGQEEDTLLVLLAEPLTDWIFFTAGFTPYAVNTSQVADIRSVDPAALQSVEGGSPFHLLPRSGRPPVACLDLGTLFFPGSPPRPTSILLVHSDESFGIFAEEIVEIAQLEATEIRPLPPLLRKLRKRPALCGIIPREPRTYAVIDLDRSRLLHPGELAKVSRATASA